MFVFKQIRIEKDAVLIGKPAPEDLKNLARQGYRAVVDIMPSALKDQNLARAVRSAGMAYRHIPVEDCDLESCHLEEASVVGFYRYMTTHGGEPLILYTDDEVLGLSLVLLTQMFREGRNFRDWKRAVEALGVSLRGRRDIRRFIQDFYRHYRPQALPV